MPDKNLPKKGIKIFTNGTLTLTWNPESCVPCLVVIVGDQTKK